MNIHFEQKRANFIAITVDRNILYVSYETIIAVYIKKEKTLYKIKKEELSQTSNKHLKSIEENVNMEVISVTTQEIEHLVREI